VESSPEVEAPRVCPPHYWLIQGPGVGRQHWTCKRCGAEREHREDVAAPTNQRWYRERVKPQPATDGPSAASDEPRPVSG
jgi:hypothetical protein